MSRKFQYSTVRMEVGAPESARFTRAKKACHSIGLACATNGNRAITHVHDPMLFQFHDLTLTVVAGEAQVYKTLAGALRAIRRRAGESPLPMATRDNLPPDAPEGRWTRTYPVEL